MAEKQKPRNPTRLYKGLFNQLKGITKRRRAAAVPQALEQTAQRSELVAQATQDAVFDWDLVSHEIWRNENYQRLFGAPERSLDSDDWWSQRLHPEDRERVLKAQQAALAEEANLFSSEFRLRRPDGSYADIVERSFIVRDAQGRAVRMIGALTDVSERKRAEEALRESEVRYRGLFENSLEGIGLSKRNQIVNANRALLDIFGYTDPEEFKAVPLLEHVAPQSRGLIKEMWEKLDRGEPIPKRFEYQITRKDGETRTLEISVDAVYFGGERYTQSTFRDITEGKRAEEALRQSEQRYRDFIAHTNDAVWCLELNPPLPLSLGEEEGLRRFLKEAYLAECNLVFALSLGFSKPEELVGRRLGDLISPLDSGRMESFRSAVRGGFQSRTVELQGEDKDGKLTNLVRTEVPIVEKGKLVRFWGITRDVTELRRAEEALRESEARFRTVFENAAIGMGLVDMQGHPIESNPALQKMLGYDKSELAQMAFTEFTHPDDVGASRDLFSELVEGKRDRYQLEKRYYRKDGKVVWGQLTESLVRNRNGEPQYAIAMLEDITERKRAEEALRESEARFRAVFENTAMGIALVDMQGHPVESNPTLQRMLGYNGLELAQMAFTEFTHPDDAQADWDLFSELVEGRRDTYHMDKRYLRKDGEVIWGGLTVSLVRNQNGEPQYCIGMVEDVTERKRAEAAVRQMSGRLLRLQDEERRRIARELHDTTAQSLAALAINLSVVKDSASNLSARARTCLSESLELAEQTSREIRTASYLLHPPLLDEIGLGLALRWYLEGFAQRTGIEFDLEVPPEPARFPAEIELALYRVAQEALTNIHLHSGSKKAHVCLKCAPHQAVLSVADEGHGLPPGLLQRGGQQGGKLGVGISGMRERIRQLGGQFEIFSNSKGTTLKAVVPLRE
jgi:PAS domain S-box-containing protein